MTPRVGPKPGRVVNHYADIDRARAVGRTLAIGPLKASRELGIPVSTLAYWRRQFPEGLPELVDVSREAVAYELWQTFMESIALIKTMLRDPKARLGDVVRATEVLRDSHALLSGGVTSRSESASVAVTVATQVHAMTAEDQAALRQFVQEQLARLDAGRIDEVERDVTAVLDAERKIVALLDSGQAGTVDEALDQVAGEV